MRRQALVRALTHLMACPQICCALTHHHTPHARPCQRIAPVYTKLAEDNPAVTFVKVRGALRRPLVI